MGFFNLFRKGEKKDIDLSNVSNENVGEFLRSRRLKLVCLISPDFGGSEGADNQVPVTPKAYEEKQRIDAEIAHFLRQEKEVRDFHVDLKYKGKSAVPSKIIITAVIEGSSWKKVIEVW